MDCRCGKDAQIENSQECSFLKKSSPDIDKTAMDKVTQTSIQNSKFVDFAVYIGNVPLCQIKSSSIRGSDLHYGGSRGGYDSRTVSTGL